MDLVFRFYFLRKIKHFDDNAKLEFIDGTRSNFDILCLLSCPYEFEDSEQLREKCLLADADEADGANGRLGREGGDRSLPYALPPSDRLVAARGGARMTTQARRPSGGA